ncbi:MAG: sigma-70 family RNA polymerase sigma factor [Pseudomonadota bacterium]
MQTPTDDSVEGFLRHRGDLIEVARMIVKCPENAEDIVQDSWLRWQRHAYPVEHSRRILTRIVKNLAIDWHRRKRRERTGLETQKLLEDPSPDMERVISARQELELVVEALGELPPRTMSTFRMSRVEGLSCAEIGRRLGISESRAYQLVGAALLHVIKRLDR